MVSVAVSKLGKTDLVFVDPGAKINSVYYCNNVLEQGLLPEIRHISNNDFVFQQDGVPAHRSRYTVAYLHCHVPEFIEPENWPPNSPDYKSGGLFCVGCVAADGVSSQNFRHWTAEARSDWLLDSVKSGHFEPSDWSAAEKTGDGY